MKVNRFVLLAIASAVLGAAIAAPLAVMASHQFVDVPIEHTFHNDINWLAETGITKGCNPSQGGDEFCPHDNVTRGQMAAFLRRFATSGVAIDSDRFYMSWFRYFTEESDSITAECDEGDILIGGTALEEPSLRGVMTFRDHPDPLPPDLWTKPTAGPNLPATGRVEGAASGWTAKAGVEGFVSGDWAAIAYCYDVP